jgi:hypothetical protein
MLHLLTCHLCGVCTAGTGLRSRYCIITRETRITSRKHTSDSGKQGPRHGSKAGSSGLQLYLGRANSHKTYSNDMRVLPDTDTSKLLQCCQQCKPGCFPARMPAGAAVARGCDSYLYINSHSMLIARNLVWWVLAAVRDTCSLNRTCMV